ncbi:hypothetical protein ACFL6S_00750 [Candidatus Poribacteria bacterium]
MKALAPVLGIVLLLIITICIVGFAFVWVIKLPEVVDDTKTTTDCCYDVNCMDVAYVGREVSYENAVDLATSYFNCRIEKHEPTVSADKCIELCQYDTYDFFGDYARFDLEFFDFARDKLDIRCFDNEYRSMDCDDERVDWKQIEMLDDDCMNLCWDWDAPYKTTTTTIPETECARWEPVYEQECVEWENTIYRVPFGLWHGEGRNFYNDEDYTPKENIRIERAYDENNNLVEMFDKDFYFEEKCFSVTNRPVPCDGTEYYKHISAEGLDYYLELSIPYEKSACIRHQNTSNVLYEVCDQWGDKK